MLDNSARTIQETRSDLKRWGQFWRRYNEGGARGVTDKFIESQRSATRRHRRKPVPMDDIRSNAARGVERPYSATCQPTYSAAVAQKKDVFVPWSLQPLDDFIESLQMECRVALKDKYINGEDVRGVWIDRAEKLVMYR